MTDPLPPNPPVTSEPKVYQRRVRYSGLHPRKFSEKYKELNPERHADTVQKIIASGKTPAGMHRPICVKEILEVLAPRPGEIAVDATLGYGGHTSELLPLLQPGGRLIALDVDPLELPRTEERLRARGFTAEQLAIHRSNFAGLSKVLALEQIAGVDLVLADLGLSSMQIDNPERGFTFKSEGPLDLRMNPQRGQPASAWLTSVAEPELALLLEENSDEPRAKIIASAIIQARNRGPLLTTTTLARVIREALTQHTPARDKSEIDTSIRRTFQAIRIQVNDEFNVLENFLRQLPYCLNPGGRVAILTFHSGEDRRVKKAFQAGERDGLYSSVAREVIRPGAEELRSNPRSTSAKLRWAIRAKS